MTEPQPPFLEERIEHWETTLEDSLRAVSVAREMLGKLYMQREVETQALHE